MLDIRPVALSEADTFLNLLCEVFDLNVGRARSIFFSEPLFDLQRKWALFEGGRMVSILTTVPLEFGWGRAVGIAGVGTISADRGRGLATRLLDEVVRCGEANGEGPAMLFAHRESLYARSGFQTIDEVVQGAIRAEAEPSIPPGLEFPRIQKIYDEWAMRDPNRLRRDRVRWNYWKWTLRVCSAYLDGYACFEGGMLREAVLDAPPDSWTLPPETQWLGLASVAQNLGLELIEPKRELLLMARDVPARPQLFMTDQF